MLKQKPFHYILLVLPLLLYLLLGYETERHQTLPLFAGYFTLFIMYVVAIANHQTLQEREFKFWIGASLLYRTALLFSVPALSDDFYRFVWDGRLLAAGHHPFAEVPSFYMSHPVAIPGINEELFDQLNAKDTFTSYPPFSQFIFWLSVKLSNGSLYGAVFTMKIIILGFEAATLWIFPRVLRQFQLPETRTLFYALNPLVILELTGNLHFEGIMIFFLLCGIILLKRKQYHWSALAYALSICTKLIPLILVPILIRQLGWRKSILFGAMTAAFTFMLSLPLLNAEMVDGLFTSLGYYFQRFEFNASIYYLIRGVGYAIFGFNIIAYAGPVLAIIAAILILTISFRNLPLAISADADRALFQRILWCLFIYFISVTILHPWYIITLLAISILTPYRFTLVWTGAIFLTYAGYTATAFNENLFLVAFEYALVIAYLLYETVWTKRSDHS